jgi:hypothetical protein
MKLSEIIKESTELDYDKIDEVFSFTCFHNQGVKLHNMTARKIIDERDGSVNHRIEAIEVRANHPGTKAYWPFGDARISNHDIFFAGNNLVFEDWSPSLFPMVTLDLDCVTIKSFRGIEHSPIKHLSFIQYRDAKEPFKFECGLLGLLKFKGRLHGTIEDNDVFNRAIEIINERREAGNLDIADCMDELIEKGCKEYAKS